MEPTTVVRVSARGVLNTPSLRLPGTCEASVTYFTPGGWRLAHRTGFPSAPINLPPGKILLRVEAVRHCFSGTTSACAVFEAGFLKEGAMVPLMKQEKRGGYLVVRRLCSEFEVTEIVFDVFVYATCGKEDMALVMREPPRLEIGTEELVKVGERGLKISRGVGLMSLLRWLRGGEKVRQEAALNVLGSVTAPRPRAQGMFVKDCSDSQDSRQVQLEI